MAGAHNCSDLRYVCRDDTHVLPWTAFEFICRFASPCLRRTRVVSFVSLARALRLIVRLGQPFSAFLLAQRWRKRKIATLLHKSKMSLLYTACRMTERSRYTAFRSTEVADFPLYLDGGSIYDTFTVVLPSYVGLQKNKCYWWWYQARPASQPISRTLNI